MKFPDVSKLGVATIEGKSYLVLLVAEDWEPDDGHDSEHARGGCECPCYPPLDAILEAVE